MKNYFKLLQVARNEDEVKQAFRDFYGIEFHNNYNTDLIHKNFISEFKYKLSSDNDICEALAQAIYYTYKILNPEKNLDKNDNIGARKYTLLGGKENTILYETEILQQFYNSTEYDWTRSSCDPDPKLIKDIIDSLIYKNCIIRVVNKLSFKHKAFEKIFRDLIRSEEEYIIQKRKIKSLPILIQIYEMYRDEFLNYVQDESKLVVYFLSDLKNIIVESSVSNTIHFGVVGDTYEKTSIPIIEHRVFWRTWDKTIDPTNSVINKIISDLDLFKSYALRNKHGLFYTRQNASELCQEYFMSVVPQNTPVWDCCVGTGNLETKLVGKYKIFLSDCDQNVLNEVDSLYKNQVKTFQYDFLNQDIPTVFELDYIDKLNYNGCFHFPKELGECLSNIEEPFSFNINPPMSSSSKHKYLAITDIVKYVLKNKSDKKFLKILKYSHIQMFYRIQKQFQRKKNLFVGTFTTMTFLLSPEFKDFRDSFNFEFVKGFLVHSSNFETKGDFPLAYLIFKKNDATTLSKQSILLDVYELNKEEKLELVGVKHIKLADKKRFLNVTKLFKQSTKKKSWVSLNTSFSNFQSCNIDDDSFGSIVQAGCGINNYSLHYFSNGRLSIGKEGGSGSLTTVFFNKDNFKIFLTLLAVFSCSEKNWNTQEDRMILPDVIPDDFINNCIVFSIFCDKSYLYSLRDPILGTLPNEFFPYKREEVINWSNSFEFLNLINRENDRFLSLYLESQDLSFEARNLLNSSKELYKLYFSNYDRFTSASRFPWDAGFNHQIKSELRKSFSSDIKFINGIEQVKKCLYSLKNKIKPKIYELGFLDKMEFIRRGEVDEKNTSI